MANFNELNAKETTTSTQNGVSDTFFKNAEVGGAKHDFYKDKSGRNRQKCYICIARFSVPILLK